MGEVCLFKGGVDFAQRKMEKHTSSPRSGSVLSDGHALGFLFFSIFLFPVAQPSLPAIAECTKVSPTSFAGLTK